jgi:quercetin dioxygenase-like cupin family protein
MRKPVAPKGNISEMEAGPQVAPYGVTVAQVIRLSELIEFRADKRVRKKLFEGAQLWGELLCYEAGQAAPRHQHPTEDEAFVILEGHAAVLAGDRELDAPAGSLVIVPATIPHDLRNVGDGRLVAIFIKLSLLSAKLQSPEWGPGCLERALPVAVRIVHGAQKYDEAA